MESTRFETLRLCLKKKWLSHTLHYCIMIHRKRMLSFSQLHYKFSAPCSAQNWACLLAYLSLKPWWTGSWKAVPIISFAILQHKVGGPNIGNPHILGEKVERVNRLSQSPHGTLKLLAYLICLSVAIWGHLRCWVWSLFVLDPKLAWCSKFWNSGRLILPSPSVSASSSKVSTEPLIPVACMFT